MSSKSEASFVSTIPRYFLYGEVTRDVDQQFLHMETIDSRSRKHEWSIKPHVHPELHHLLFVERGGGRFDIDAQTIDIAAPAIISVPAQLVHGFQFLPDTEGWVITSSNALLQRISLVHPEFESLLYHQAVIPVSIDQSASMRERFSALAVEFLDERIARRAAAESVFLAILVNAVRIRATADIAVTTHHDADVDLVMRYRNLIEKNFRARVSTSEYAMRLCICHERLRSACVRITSTSPLVLLNARRLLEAKRYLLYTSMNISEVAYQSGFEDAAYFSRFFARNVGRSPRDYRIANAR